MIILTLRTDKPEAEIGLYDDQEQLAYETWTAHRQLAETLHAKIQELLKNQNKDWADIQGIIIFKGPGSFTGLRIGMSVANALAYSLSVPIIGTIGDNWQTQGIENLLTGKSDKVAVPEYGSEAHITAPRK